MGASQALRSRAARVLAAGGLGLGGAAILLAAPLLAQGRPWPGAGLAHALQTAAPAALRVPAAAQGSWQTVLDGPAGGLRTRYAVEVKIGGFAHGMPEAVVSYFAGNAQRPSTICRSQLNLVAIEGPDFVFAETLNHRGGKEPCPVRQQIVITPDEGKLTMRWRDGGRRPRVRLEATAYRASGGNECRIVGGDGGNGGQTWCRDAEGNWSPQRRT